MKNYSTPFLSTGNICPNHSLYHKIAAYMCLNIMWYRTFLVLFEISMIICRLKLRWHFPNEKIRWEFLFEKFVHIIVVTYTIFNNNI